MKGVVMVRWLSSLFKNEEQPLELDTPNNVVVVFELSYKNLIVGYLKLAKGMWTFEYSEEFKKQHEISPIIDFPYTNKVYSSNYLWPFFAHRIPGLGQPQIQEIIRQENLNPKNDVDLLRRFGHKSITNPFELAVSP